MEFFPLVDTEGTVTGKASRDECHNRSFLLHPVVHCVILSSVGEWLLQKRSTIKDIQPGKWDTSVGGHVQYGESIEAALRREVLEEVGVDLVGLDPRFVHTYINRTEVERELVYTYTVIHQGPFVAQASEVDELIFWTTDEITDKLGSGIFTPNFEEEFWRFTRSTIIQ